MAKYIDIGANLTKKQFNDISALLNDAKEWNVERIIITGTTVNNSKQAFEMINMYKWYPLYSTAGVHPHDAKTCNKNTLDELRNLLKNDNVVAVGECGLDYDRMFSPKNVQLEWFRKQLDLAVEFNKPVFLHERSAFDDFYNIMVEYKDKIRGVVHCFTGTKEQAQKYIDLGLYIGLTGFICDKRRNKETLEALHTIPLDRLMIETDAPFMSPVGKHPNYPSYVSYVTIGIAEELKLKEQELAHQVYNNTIQFFNLS
ncbi:TatD-like protein [Fadolivirus algeromassiliense]|jgi:TatD DNase family protein|uniref:TatD-like protein n=1 Tax=Fadolivirus FV1/VV64 TaxID=3070911 RepID=A0A7D3QUX5_9VIRU|nr:TatD-like protein [Fadolivirus algeromassiliense]QKF94547.1 TatD-like protein [Fadolivirus FV1/VV64]